MAAAKEAQQFPETIWRVFGWFVGPMGGTIAMRLEYLTAIALVALVAGAGTAIHSGSLPVEAQATPAAVQLALAESVNSFLSRSGG